MTRPTFTEARDAVACRSCRAEVGDNCRGLLDKPLRACHGVRMDDALAILNFLPLEAS